MCGLNLARDLQNMEGVGDYPKHEMSQPDEKAKEGEWHAFGLLLIKKKREAS